MDVAARLPRQILLVDDHPIVRRGIREIFDEVADVSVACEAANGHEAIHQLGSHALDGVLLDISMPGRSGVDVLRHIRSAYPALPVLMLSSHSEAQYALSMLKAGARGYVAKGQPSSEILQATRMVLRGERYVSPFVSQLLLDDYSRRSVSAVPHELLSIREFEIFRMLALGKGASQIARELFVSAKTVTTHRSHILEKMNLKTSADLSLYAIRNQLIE